LATADLNCVPNTCHNPAEDVGDDDLDEQFGAWLCEARAIGDGVYRDT